MNNMKNMTMYRSVWMGFAILCVILFHFGFTFNNPILDNIKLLGYGGVDIFVFASGVGCFYSLAKSNEILAYAHRRIKRILPTYYIYALVYFSVNYFMSASLPSLLEVAGNIFLVGWLFGMKNQISWYLDLLLITYLLAPFLYSIVTKPKNRRSIIITFVVLLLFAFTFINQTQLMLFSRLPIFFIGIIFGKLSYYEYRVKRIDKILLFVFMIIGLVFLFVALMFFNDYLSLYGLFWWPFILITPGLCYMISYVSSNFFTRIPKNILNKMISYIGSISFELFLVHGLVISITSNLVALNKIQINNFYWLLAMIVSFFGAILLSYMTKLINKLFKI